jgi:DNA-binding transcriptional LysR family regulator
VQFQQLRSFVTVAELRHFTQAADRIGIAQPSLSKQIHSLEADLGTPLFERGPAGVALTQAGEALLPFATRIVADVDTARRAIEQLVGLGRGRVRLGATPSLSTSIVPALLQRFRRAYPGIDLHIQEGGSRDLERSLAEGALDLALIVLRSPSMADAVAGTDAALAAEPLLRERLVVASTEALPKEIAIGELRRRPLVMFRPGYDLRDATLEACRQAGFVPQFAVEGGEMDAVLSLVEAGLGAAIVPGGVLAGRRGLHAARITPAMHRVIAVAKRRDAPLPHAAEALRETLRLHLYSRKLPGGDQLLF